MAKRKRHNDERGGNRSHVGQDMHKKPKTAQGLGGNAVAQLPKATITLASIPSYPSSLIHVHSTILPPLPTIQDKKLSSTPFKHSSAVKQNIGQSTGLHESYERLEFLGDAYLELFATRLLFHRFALHTSSQQFTSLLQIREDIVSNETLAGFARVYAFFEKLEISKKDQFNEDNGADNKGIGKILADCFEAFVAAVTLDASLGFASAERWLAELWEDKIQALTRQHRLRELQLQDRHVTDIPQSNYSPDNFHDTALDFLGGGYIELMATRLVFTRFENMATGRMSQLTEKLIKKDTLAKLAREWNLPALTNIEKAAYKNPKDRLKALAGAQRAHIGRAVLDGENRISEVEEQLLHAWAPILVEEIHSDRVLGTNLASGITNIGSSVAYDPNAKAVLQKRILGGRNVRLEYENYQDSVELKGAQLGQSRHFVACYLTGYGHTKKLLGRGEGRSKTEAGNWAATDAMRGVSKTIVDECEVWRNEERERKKAERLAQESAHESVIRTQHGVNIPGELEEKK